jgi:orotate phosphoribosyltransferase
LKDKYGRELAQIIRETGTMVFGVFTMTSGLKSPYYLDLGILYSYPREYGRVIEILSQTIDEEVEGDYVIAGVPLRGLPYAVSVANKLSKPFLLIRKEAKSHGMERRIEGRYRSGSQVVLVDDVATTGGSLLEAADALKEEGLMALRAFVVVDRLQGARANLEKKGVTLTPLIDILELISLLEETGEISGELAERVRSYTMGW